MLGAREFHEALNAMDAIVGEHEGANNRQLVIAIAAKFNVDVRCLIELVTIKEEDEFVARLGTFMVGFQLGRMAEITRKDTDA